jgi:hypothetical protein
MTNNFSRQEITMEYYLARWTGLALGILAGCGSKATIGILPPDPRDSGNPPQSTPDTGPGKPDAGEPDSGLPRIDAGVARFHLIDPTPAHLQRAASNPGTRRLHTNSKWVSSDGSVVVGQSSVVTKASNDPARDGTGDGLEVFRWTEASGTVGLGVLPACEPTDGTLPRGLADWMRSDGSVIFGTCNVNPPPAAPDSRSYRWTQASGMVAVVPEGYGLSHWNADGTVATGTAWRAIGDYQTFHWTQAGGVQLLGVLPGTTYGDPRNLTPDGKTIIGHSGGAIFRWSQATGMVGLAKAGYDTCIPEDVSDDGNIVLGTCSSGDGAPGSPPQQFFVWKGTSEPVRVPLPSGRAGVGRMSPDGAVIVGGFGHDATYAGFRWTEPTGLVAISLPGYTNCSVDYPEASADGAILIGSCDVSPQNDTPMRGAFRWTQATGPVSLSPLPGDAGAMADAISADGTIVIGRSVLPGPDIIDPTTPQGGFEVRVPRYVAVMWDANGKVTSLTDLFTSMGFDLQGYTLKTGTISPTDAHVISGVASNAESLARGWIARLP